MPTSLTYNEGDYSLDGLLTGSVAVKGDDGASTVGWVPTSGFITRHFVSSPPYQYMEHFLGLLNPRWGRDPPYKKVFRSGFHDNATGVVWGKEHRRDMHTKKIHRLLTKFAVPNNMGANGTHFW